MSVNPSFPPTPINIKGMKSINPLLIYPFDDNKIKMSGDS